MADNTTDTVSTVPKMPEIMESCIRCIYVAVSDQKQERNICSETTTQPLLNSNE